MSIPIIEPERLLLISDIPGYTPQISRLICMMNYARQVTLRSVKDLTIKELDYLHDKKSNSIGALLLHLAATDFYYQKFSFDERNLTEREFKKWKSGLELGELARKEIKGKDLKYYLNILNRVRNRTYKLLKSKDDEWLEREISYGKINSNYYYAWYHVMEDEINHRGQISWLRKRLGNLK